MVSVVLLTTEEVLQRNGFWYCLDSIWITEELEPFEEIQPLDRFSKPLSRDFYYTKFPDIPRSESEDENPISFNGFKSKHLEWKSKVCVKRFYAQRKNSINSNSSTSSVNFSTSSERSRRGTASVNNIGTQPSSEKKTVNRSDDRIRDFFQRITKNVPPPPVNNLEKPQTYNYSLVNVPKQDRDLNDIDLPNYVDFAKNKMIQANSDQNLATTSTLKKSKRRVSFNLDTFVDEFEHRESWSESIFGLSDIDQVLDNVTNSKISEEHVTTGNSFNNVINFPSWSEIIDECDVSESIMRSKESLISSEELISCSNCLDEKIFESHLDEENEGDNDEIGYARFAIYKIHHTLRVGYRMVDSSSLKDLGTENESTADTKNNSFLEKRYFLTSNMVNMCEPVATCTTTTL